MESNPIDEEDIKAFLIESFENLDQIENDILNLEQSSTDREILSRIYRALHSIKGNCGFLPFPKLEAIAHASETLLGGLRDTQLSLTPELTTTLLHAIDAIRQLLATIEATQQEGNTDYSDLLQKLTTLRSPQSGSPQSGSPQSGSPQSGSPQSGSPQSSAPSAPQSGDRSPQSALDSTPVGNGSANRNSIDRTSPDPMPSLDLDDLYLASSLDSSQTGQIHSASTIRVDVSLLDQVIDLVGELVLVRNQLLQLVPTQADALLAATCQRLSLITGELQEGVMQTRMQPIQMVWQKFPRFVRELAIAFGKQVRVEMEGAETELDRNLIEAIKDPLMHLVRNAVGHGIETPDIRRNRGKSLEGRLFLRAFHESGKVNLVISDDGNGMDAARLRQRAQELGMISPAQAIAMTDLEALQLIFRPGFSTATQVTHLSGRGVGMDVVRTNLDAINGSIEVESQAGQGTTFHLKIPLTLAIIPALLMTTSGDRFVISQANVQELVRLEGKQVQQVEQFYDVPVYRLRGQILPLVDLNQVLGFKERWSIHQETEVLHIVVLQADDTRFGLVVDAIEDSLDIVVKPLGSQLKHLTIFAGATILGDGKVALILDAIGLAHQAGITVHLQTKLTQLLPAPPTASIDRPMILLFQVQQTQMGIPLTQAARLEVIPVRQITALGAQLVIQYRDQILPLIDLQSVLAVGDRSPPQSTRAPLRHDDPEDTVTVVVTCLNSELQVGFIVDRVIDIVEDALEIRGVPSRPGVLLNAVIQGQITEILDVEAIVQLTNAHLITPVVMPT